jgi:thiamine biosynthesis lipoprotein
VKQLRQPGASPEVQSWHLHKREEVMGTVVTLDTYGEGTKPPREVHVRAARARAVLQRADAVFSTWKEHSPLNQFRRGEITADQAPPEVREVLQACERAKLISDGYFDPWALPGGVDPTGYVKGWAAQRAAEMLYGPGVGGAVVNAAGDIATCGSPAPGRPFQLGVADPSDRRRIACVVEISGAIATSGTSERGNHLVNPKSGQWEARAASASVTGPDLGLADALATALAVAGEEGLAFVEATPAYEGLVIGYDGSWHATPGFPFHPLGNPSGRAHHQPAEANHEH